MSDTQGSVDLNEENARCNRFTLLVLLLIAAARLCIDLGPKIAKAFLDSASSEGPSYLGSSGSLNSLRLNTLKQP